MKESVNVKWDGGMSFKAEVIGYEIMMDADPEFGGQDKGPKPKPLLMVALGGCTGMDVISLLNKMRVRFKALNIKIDGEITDEHPKKYKDITITYEITGKDIDRSKVEMAVNLSKDKYCGVSASINETVDIKHVIKIINI